MSVEKGVEETGMTRMGRVSLSQILSQGSHARAEAPDQELLLRGDGQMYL